MVLLRRQWQTRYRGATVWEEAELASSPLDVPAADRIQSEAGLPGYSP